MLEMLDGLARYREVHNTRQDLFDDLATGQAPPVLFLTCADSRVDPSLITQSDPGQLFVCRNAGNIVPPARDGAGAEGMAASIEYAVKALKVGTIIVCGHADCGAVKGAMAPDSVASLPWVAAWLAHANTGGNSDVDAAIEANVLAQLENLGTYDFIAEAVASGALKLVGWVYDIKSGAVRMYDGDGFVDPHTLVGSSS